ncbi:MAG: radical SAM protein [Candidatus Omnitrophota bacterium]
MIDDLEKRKMLLSKYPLLLIYRLISGIFSYDSRIARRLPNYFPAYRSFGVEFLNQFLRLIHSPKSFLPQGIVIEPTSYCNLRCKHCIPQAINEDRGYIDYELYKYILDDNPQLTCLILARNGEPFLHPRIFDLISLAKSKNIYVSLYTNGILVSDEKANRILSTGLDEINFSMEDIENGYEKNRGISYHKLKHNMGLLIKKRNQIRSSLKIGINIAVIEKDDYAVRAIQKEWDSQVDHIDVEPLMGEKISLRTKSCHTLWRNLVVRWNGIVLPCCIDMNSTLVMGDIKNNSLKEIFNSSNAKAIRESHIKNKFPPVCKYCDEFFG